MDSSPSIMAHSRVEQLSYSGIPYPARCTNFLDTSQVKSDCLFLRSMKPPFSLLTLHYGATKPYHTTGLIPYYSNL
nr:hypothetical protein [Vibrio alginolyticus]